MPARCLTPILLVSALPFAISAAQASCGDRPGTPNELRAEVVTGFATPTIRFSWRNTTGKGLNKSGSTSSGDAPHTMYFDIKVRADEKETPLPGPSKDYTGHGPFKVTYGMRRNQDFDHLSTPQRLCFWIRARTERGTKGCVSQIWAGPVCATTATSPQTPASPQKPIKHTGKPGGEKGAPNITVLREAGNVFHVIGTSLRPNVPVAIRVVDARTLMGPIVTSIGGRPIVSRGGGLVDVRLYGFCDKTQGPLSFSLNDGRENKADKTGTLWSNTVQQTCQR